MASNIYEMLMTRNAELVRFCDANPNFAEMIMKVIRMAQRVIKEDLKMRDGGAVFEVYGPRDSSCIVVRIKKPGS